MRLAGLGKLRELNLSSLWVAAFSGAWTTRNPPQNLPGTHPAHLAPHKTRQEPAENSAEDSKALQKFRPTATCPATRPGIGGNPLRNPLEPDLVYSQPGIKIFHWPGHVVRTCCYPATPQHVLRQERSSRSNLLCSRCFTVTFFPSRESFGVFSRNKASAC